MRERHVALDQKVLDLDLDDRHVQRCVEYLCRYGYLAREAVRAPDAVARALTAYQHFYRLAPTGEITLETVKMMGRPRCGVPDPVEAIITGGNTTADPIVYLGNRWSQTDLRYFIASFTADMSGEASVIGSAFDVWAGVTPLGFERTFDASEADITLSWGTFNHGDGSPFDGQGGTLAHAIGPGAGTFVHFDDSERWGSSGSGGRRDLLTVAIHEIGHALGLGHSSEEDAVMFASYDGEKRSLHELDIKGIRSRYPVVHHFGNARAARVSLWGLKNTGGCDVRRVSFSERRRLVAWGQRTMVDPLSDFDRDNAWGIEIIEVDGQRIEPRVSGGAHWGSAGSPNNVHQGAWSGTASSVTFRLGATHTADLDAFGVGCVLSL